LFKPGYWLNDHEIVVQFPALARDLSYLLCVKETGSGAQPASCSMRTGAISSHSWSVKVTTHSHVMPRLRMTGDKPPLPYMHRVYTPTTTRPWQFSCTAPQQMHAECEA